MGYGLFTKEQLEHGAEADVYTCRGNHRLTKRSKKKCAMARMSSSIPRRVPAGIAPSSAAARTAIFAWSHAIWCWRA